MRTAKEIQSLTSPCDQESSGSEKKRDAASVSALLAFASLPGLGREAVSDIIAMCLRLSETDGLWDRLVHRAVGLGYSRTALDTAWQAAERQGEECRVLGVRILSILDDRYPPRLSRIPHPPALLFVRGSLDALHAQKSVALIGTREPSAYGAAMSTRLGGAAAEAGYAVVSGLAAGCDTGAHAGSLASGALNVAVLAHGLHMIHPPQNAGLADQILAGGGCVVSEYPLGTPKRSKQFVARDRLQSGLSDLVIVIETDIKGGAMHTARFARAQGRPVACVASPGEWLATTAASGNRKLLADFWAEPIYDAEAFKGFLARLETISTA